MGLNENFCKKRKNKFAFCVKMSTLALSYRALRFEILHFGRFLLLWESFLFCFEGISEKILKK